MLPHAASERTEAMPADGVIGDGLFEGAMLSSHKSVPLRSVSVRWKNMSLRTASLKHDLINRGAQ